MNNPNLSVKEPTKLLPMILSQLKLGGEFLDLGCGRGADTIFMAEKGFQVTAVDHLAEVINNLQKKLAEKEILKDRIKLFCQDISVFEIEKNKYQAINVSNSLQSLDKEVGLRVIERIKENLSVGGFLVLKGFTTGDPSYQEPLNHCFFEPEELKNLFSDFEIIFYEERTIDEAGHHGYEKPHQHSVVRMMAKKIE